MASAGCAIRALGPENAPTYKTLRDAALALHPTAFTSDAAEEAGRPAKSYVSRFGSPEATSTLGAFVGARLVSALTCERDHRLKVRHVGHLTGMMVEESARGGGIGRALLRVSIESARQAGLTLLTLTATADNAEAIGLYQSAGFSVCGSLPHAIRVDGVYYAKAQMMLLL